MILVDNVYGELLTLHDTTQGMYCGKHVARLQ